MILWNKLNIYIKLLNLTEYDIVVPNSIFFSKDRIYDQKIPKLVIKVNSGTSEKICSFIFNRKRVSFFDILNMLTNIYPDVQVKSIMKDLNAYLEELNKYGIIVYSYAQKDSLIRKIKFYFLIFIKGHKNRKDIESSNILSVLITT